MRDFIRFETMITPMLIAFLFWLGVLLCLFVGVGYILHAIFSGDDLSHLMIGVLLVIFGPFVIRIYAEILMVVFRINDHLRQIVHNTQRT